MKPTALLAVLLLLACFLSNPAYAASDRDKAVVTVARAWLALIDDGLYAESWRGASAYFRGAVSEQKWEAALDGVRTPLGKLISRREKSAKRATQLPGAPDGHYLVMVFTTSFENKKSAIETVTFVQEKDGSWKAAGYFIK